MSSDHVVTVTVSLRDGTVIQKAEGFNGGNPRFHAHESAQAGQKALDGVYNALTGMYGTTPTGAE